MSDHDEQLYKIAHDTQHCLHVIGMGLEILKGARDDDDTFDQICEAMGKEQRKAAKLIDAFLDATCDGLD
ncbi:hypothetical protein [Rubrivirga sp. IMCC43871]|uniref:hypothetical protein n=1 Tax=Rubrivirga sp. IMCC43871 TaxID=3391575 RepID=UPI00398FC2A7